MKKLEKITVTILLSALIMSIFAEIETIILQQGLDGYTGCKDTYLSGPDSINGGIDTIPKADAEELVLHAYHCSWCIDKRVILYFDLAGINSNLDIGRATLSLYCIQDEGIEAISQLSLITSEWDVEYANWYKAMQNKDWKSEGGDFSTTLIDSFIYPFTTAGQWQNFDITGETKDFLNDPDSNLGFFIQMNVVMTGITYASSECPDQIKRPRIKIMHGDGDYDPPQITVDYPKGDEKFIANSKETIKWTAADNEKVVACVIYFTPDSWTGWQKVDSLSGNPGEYIWDVPDDKYIDCNIKVEAYDATGNMDVDEPDKPFDINKPSSIMPNKFNTNFNSQYSVSIINIQGRIISSFNVTDLANINKYMTSLPSGIHLVSIKTPGNVIIKKCRVVR